MLLIIILACMGLNGKTMYIPLDKFIFQLYFCLSFKNSSNYRNYKKLSKSKKEKLQTIKKITKSEEGLEKLFVTTLKLPTITLGFFLSKLHIAYILVSVVTISCVKKKTSCPLPPFKNKKN